VTAFQFYKTEPLSFGVHANPVFMIREQDELVNALARVWKMAKKPAPKPMKPGKKGKKGC
jgi:hypothetical protein